MPHNLLLFSTANLVSVRASGVLARFAALLGLASALPPSEFAVCAFAFALSEVARALSDGGVDPVMLRAIDTLHDPAHENMARQALTVKLINSATVLIVVVLGFFWMSQAPLLAALIAMQFVPQALLQTLLNVAQSRMLVSHLSRPLLCVYAIGLVMAVACFLQFEFGRFALPLISIGELCCVLWFGRTYLFKMLPSVVSAYRTFYPLAMGMAGISILAIANSRADSLLVHRLLDPDTAGRYMYLMRWADTVPTFVGGIAMPLVGKIRSLLSGEDHRLVKRALVVVCVVGCTLPFFIVGLAATSGPAPGSTSMFLHCLIAGTGAARVLLAVVGVLMLSHWLDKSMLIVVAASTVTMSAAVLALGSVAGAIGVAFAVLLVECANLVAQVVLIRRMR